MNTYDPGDSARLVGTFTNVSGVLTDPTTVVLHLVPPVLGGAYPGTVFYTYAGGAVIRRAAGSYTYDWLNIPSGTPGIWSYSYVGSGDINAVFVSQFFVKAPPRG